MSYSCPTREEEAPIWNTIMEPRFDKDPPLPRIESISVQGAVTIVFNKEMQAEAVLAERDFDVERSAGRVLARDAIQVEGHPTADFKNFTRLHNDRLWINGTLYPSVSISIEPDDPEDIICGGHLGFTWETTDYNEDKWLL